VDLNDGIHVIDAASAQMLTPARSGLRDRLEYSPEGALRVAPRRRRHEQIDTPAPHLQ
jgi:hypothetical protein